MRHQSLVRWAAGGSLLLLLCVGSIFGCSGDATDPRSPVQFLQQLTGSDRPAAPRLADELHTELLTARSSLLDFVTVQDTGSRVQGLRHLQNAQARAEELGALVEERPDLNQLRPFVLRFKGDLTSYQLALSSVLRLADSGIRTGDVYHDQIRRWSRRGAALASDADSLQVLAYAGNGIRRDPVPTLTRSDVHSGLEAVSHVGVTALSGSILGGIIVLFMKLLRRNRKALDLAATDSRAGAAAVDAAVSVSALESSASGVSAIEVREEEPAIHPQVVLPTRSGDLHFGALSELLDCILDPNDPQTDREAQHVRGVAIAASCIHAMLETA